MALENGGVDVAPRRWTATVPLLLLAAAAGILAPIVGTAALAAVVLPALATVGDLRRGRRRLAVPWRLARNLSASLGVSMLWFYLALPFGAWAMVFHFVVRLSVLAGLSTGPSP